MEENLVVVGDHETGFYVVDLNERNVAVSHVFDERINAITWIANHTHRTVLSFDVAA